MEQQDPSFLAGRNANWHSHFGRQLGSFLEAKLTFTVQSSNCAPWYLPKVGDNLHPPKNLCMDTALFTVAKTWKQPKYPSTGDWINRWKYTYAMNFFLAMTKDQP